MHGLELLKKGCIWRICNGNSVRIWRDNWIPKGNMKINMNPTRSRTRWVADLIDQESHAWKEDYIMRIFTREDANDILSIRLPNYDDEDYIAWQPEKNGIFSVRSAYRLAMDEKGSGVIGSSHNTQGDRSIWNNIWKTNVPQKVRIFTWRLASRFKLIDFVASQASPRFVMYVGPRMKQASIWHIDAHLQGPCGTNSRRHGTCLLSRK